MQDINSLKQQEVTDTPLFLFECLLPYSGTVERWSTHGVTVDGVAYRARVLSHNLFELKASLDDGADGAARIALVLANADSYFSEIEWNEGFKGAQLIVRFTFYDVQTGQSASEQRVVFRGVAGPPDEITESTYKVTFTNRLNLQRVQLPEIRIQRRCPWAFPGTPDQQKEGVDGGPKGRYSSFYRCGYSAGQTNGVGNLDSTGQPFSACDYTRAQCEERGMFDHDSAGNLTRRFGGIEFVPASVLVRSYGEKGSHVSPLLDNEARYDDFVPLLYGTAWYQPPVVFARNDGNLTRFEVLLGAGEINGVVKVIVNSVEIPHGVDGGNMTGTGWFHVVSAGERSGAFNIDFTDSGGNPLGDPYGSMAFLSVVVPNRINSGTSLPRIDVLAQGIKLARFDASGQAIDGAFSNNPAWVLLDILRRSGWSASDLDLKTFAETAAYCDQLVATKDINGNDTTVPRFQCNLVIRRRRGAADIVRGVRNAAGLLLSYGTTGLMTLRAENTLALQQAVKSEFSNSADQLDGGWPSYEFSDGSAPFSGILRKANGEAYIRFWARSAAESPNRYTVEFQDEFNEYQQDSLSLVDIDDTLLMGQEITATLPALGLPNANQATRIAALQLNKSIAGNLYTEFATSVRGFGLVPGDLIAITHEKEGLTRQPFRVVKLTLGVNYRTAVITAQYHNDEWYSGTSVGGHAGRREPAFGLGIPRPLLGAVLDDSGQPQFTVVETARQSADGSYAIGLSIGFSAPSRPVRTGVGIPSLSLTPAVQTTGGSIKGGQTLYYGVSGVDAQSDEGALSFTVRATIPSGTDTNAVGITNLSFSPTAAGFHVYRGETPSQLVRIAKNVAINASFTDEGGVPTEIAGPPDENYDHANFYWRVELQPEVVADLYSESTIGNSTLHMLLNENRTMVARIWKGSGSGQERAIASNDSTTLTITPKWDVVPDATSTFLIAESSWRFGALTVQGPAEFEIPNRKDAIAHILGRSANVHDQECATELSAITRWKIGGAGTGALDNDVPPPPIFGLIPTSGGGVELSGIGFQDLTNTRTVTAGTLTLLFADELAGVPGLLTGSGVVESDTTLPLSTSGAAAPVANDILQVGSEIMTVTSVVADGTACEVTRGSHQSSAQPHDAGTPVYVLSHRVYIVPFVRDFFGSPASGSYSFPIYLPDVRIGAAELFLTNDHGDSPVTRVSFMSLADDGIRTLSGGQFSIQLDGALSLQADVAPPLLVEDAHSVRDIYALVRQAATGDVQLRLKQDGAPYCDLTIPGGNNRIAVNGFSLPPLKAKSQLSLDIVGVPQAPDAFPGADLTVTIRM